MAAVATSDFVLKRPGFGLPLTEMPDGLSGKRFPSLLCEEEWAAATLTIREVFMLWVVEQITNKPSWHTKVFDDEILAKWKAELEQAPWKQATGYSHGGPCSEKMWTHIVQELQSKAKLCEATGLVPVFDVSTAVVKSDSIISEELKHELRRAAAPLEDVPDEAKDWHPRSNGQVLDLVHPSLCPLVYGRSRVILDREITLDNCLNEFGLGETVPQPSEGPKSSRSWGPEAETSLWSNRFQWLPCEVDITSDSPKIVSYINNLHPTRHRDLYGVIEKFIAKSIPLWDFIYQWPTERDSVLRIPCTSVMSECTVPEICNEADYGCDRENRPLDDGEERPGNYQELRQSQCRVKDDEWFYRTHPAKQPEPRPFSQIPELTSEHFRTENFFSIRRGHYWEERQPGPSRLQVIVKLANIQLTPDKPTYDGGAWHIEGQLNEHICATALYYYDSENITPSHLAFRTIANEEDMMMELSYEQGDISSINATFAIDADGNTLQNLGRTATPEGRLLTFPNVYQHRVAPFELADKTKPGHRKILALFLVDPHVPVISTSNVPPQQEEWWLGEQGIEPVQGETAKLPAELRDMVKGNIGGVISLEEAKKLRLELMDERTRMDQVADGVVSEGEWNFCEH